MWSPDMNDTAKPSLNMCFNWITSLVNSNVMQHLMLQENACQGTENETSYILLHCGFVFLIEQKSSPFVWLVQSGHQSTNLKQANPFQNSWMKMWCFIFQLYISMCLMKLDRFDKWKQIMKIQNSPLLLSWILKLRLIQKTQNKLPCIVLPENHRSRSIFMKTCLFQSSMNNGFTSNSKCIVIIFIFDM